MRRGAVIGDPHRLQRFVDAQSPVYELVLRELADGAKRSDWMWFIFPQLRALGRSVTAQHFGLDTLAEAQAYLAHPLLGPRLKQCTQAVLRVQGRSALQIFGMPDVLKFCSSMTLFERAAAQEPVFAQALDTYCAGQRDAQTLALL
jgi:uncharacterized protein (DUF1810 family)